MRIIRDTNIDDVIFINIETNVLPLTDTRLQSWRSKMGKRSEKDGFDLTESYLNTGSLYPEFSRIKEISAGSIVDNVLNITRYSEESEKLMLKKINRDLDRSKKTNSKKVLFGYGVQGFGIPFIFKRSLINNIVPSVLVDYSTLKPWEIDILDLKTIWKSTGYSTATLNNLLECFGLQMYEENNTNHSNTKIKITGIANLFLRLSHKGVISEIKEIEAKQYVELRLIDRIAEEGCISDIDSLFILKKASNMTIEQKEMLITILKASLSYRKTLLSNKFENKILSA